MIGKPENSGCEASNRAALTAGRTILEPDYNGVRKHTARVSPPSLVESVNHEGLRTIRPTLIANDSGDKQRVTTQFANGLNRHFPNARSEGRHGDAERGGVRDSKWKFAPVHSFSWRRLYPSRLEAIKRAFVLARSHFFPPCGASL